MRRSRTSSPFTTTPPTLRRKAGCTSAPTARLYPSIRRNAANRKLNFGVTDTRELDFDSQYFSIFRSKRTVPRRLNGVSDVDPGVKWKFLKADSPPFRDQGEHANITNPAIP